MCQKMGQNIFCLILITVAGNPASIVLFLISDSILYYFFALLMLSLLDLSFIRTVKNFLILQKNWKFAHTHKALGY